MRRVEFFADDLIQRIEQTLARGKTVNGNIFHAVRDPDIHHRRGAQLLAEPGRDTAAGFAMIDPELADFIVGVRQRKAVSA